MRELIVLSYGVLYMLVFLETILLYELVHRTAEVKQFYKWGYDAGPVSSAGMPAPAFSAPLMSSDQVLTNVDLVGRSAILLFVSPDEEIYPDKDLEFFAHVLWHKSDGNVYLICCGEKDVCHKLKTKAIDQMEHRIPVLWDRNGQIAHQFRISFSPQAVELDREGCVVRYGGMLPGNKGL